MEYRQLGRSGLFVSPLCLGAMMFGNQTDDAASARIISMARDAGVNFIDTADVYKKGESERIVGKHIHTDRDRWVLATKVGNAMGDGPNQRGLGRKWMIEAIDASLTRLGTDYVDLWYFHRDDPTVLLDECLETVADIIAEGKVRYWGFSNYKGWRVAQMATLCKAQGLPMPAAGQPYYNAMNRQPEVDYLPACDHFGIGVVSYSPLARGVLTGKYGAEGTVPEGSRAGRQDKRILEAEFRRESFAFAQQIKAHAEKKGMTAGQFAVNWVLNNKIVTSALVGPRTEEQWQENLGALEHEFTAEDEALVDAMVPRGHPSTPGYSDPAYPITGRLPRG